MGSVLDLIECPNCKQEAVIDFYYKTGEEYIFCKNCGYSRRVTIINRDKALNDLNDSDWEIKEIKNPFGAYRIGYQDGTYQIGTLLNEDDYIELSTVVDLNESSAIEYSSVSRFIDGEIKEEILVNNEKNQ